MTKKIAFLFLIYDTINHEELWKYFFSKADKNKYTIYIHYKNYIKSEYFDQYKLKNIINTKWGDISLVKAHNILLREALKDNDNQHFILVSNSCIPLKKFDYVYNLLDINYSYYNLFIKHHSNERTMLARICVNNVNNIKKAHQWSILNRKHADLLQKAENNYIHWFKIIPDEHAHITYLFETKLENELKLTYDGIETATTFTNWTEKRTLQNYSEISDYELSFLVKSPCLFGRKFTEVCDLKLLYNLI